MKTPEELKAQAIDDSGCCGACEYYRTTYDHPFGCADAQEKTMIVMELVEYTNQLETRLAQAERERDAAVSDISRASAFLCRACRKNDWPNCEAGRNNLDPDDVIECDDFEWRGICQENTKEERGNV